MLHRNTKLDEVHANGLQTQRYDRAVTTTSCHESWVIIPQRLLGVLE